MPLIGYHILGKYLGKQKKNFLPVYDHITSWMKRMMLFFGSILRIIFVTVHCYIF